MHNVDVGRVVPDYKYIHNKAESKLPVKRSSHDFVNVCVLA